MPERMRAAGRVALLLAGIGTAALTALGGWAALLAGVAAQPLLARGVGARTLRDPRELGPLFAWWAGAALALGAAAWWPLASMQRAPSLSAAFALSAVAGLALVGLWRIWPFWSGLEREGGPPSRHWHAAQHDEVGAWRGLGVAVPVTLLSAGIVLLAWPGLVPTGGRWVAGIAFALAAPVLHLAMQRVRPVDASAPAAVYEEDAEPVDAAPVVEAPLPPVVDPAAQVAALYAAARAGRIDRALELLAAGADVHALPPEGERDQRSLPVLAAVLPDLRLLRALIAQGVDLNRVHAGTTPLLAATRDSWHGRPDAVMTLLANGADPRARDGEGNTPLHHAARSSDPGVAALLHDAAADLAALNREGLSPLAVACASGNWRLAKFLLERGARPEPDGGQPALLAAARTEDDDAAGVQLLLRHKAKVGARDANGRSALHEAAFAGHVEIVEALLAAGADPTVTDDEGRTPLLDAARGGRLAVFERLLARLPHGVAGEAAASDAQGRNALILACVAEIASPELVSRLLELGVDPQHADHDGRTALDHAAAAGRWSLVRLLDAGYALPSAVTDTGTAEAPTPDLAPFALLREALREGRDNELDRIRALVTADELGALLHDDAIAASPQAIDWLLAHGAPADARDRRGDTLAFALMARGPIAAGPLRALLHRGASPAGAGGLARFLAASLVGGAGRAAEAIALDLLDRGADPFAPSRAGDPPLTIAVRLGWAQLAARLLATGVDLDARDSHGMTPLHLAAALGRTDLLKALIVGGASPDRLAADGQTPLGVALSSGRRDLADWLDWRGWPLPRRPVQPADLPSAAIVGDADAVRRLIDLGLPVDAVDSQGCTALLRAAGGGHRAVVDLLLARGADLACTAHSGATALSAAVSMRHAEIVDRLLASGADIEQRLPGGLTALMVACALGLPDLSARLLAAGADVQSTDAQDRTALHCAAMFGFTARDRARLLALLDSLLLAGADVAREAGGATPLLLLLGARAEPGTAADEDVLIAGLERLLDDGAALDVHDARGFGPLHLAALHGLVRVVQRLLRAGADPDRRDTLNRTPREIALMRGFIDIAAEFAPTPGGPVSMARFLRDNR